MTKQKRRRGPRSLWTSIILFLCALPLVVALSIDGARIIKRPTLSALKTESWTSFQKNAIGGNFTSVDEVNNNEKIYVIGHSRSNRSESDEITVPPPEALNDFFKDLSKTKTEINVLMRMPPPYGYTPDQEVGAFNTLWGLLFNLMMFAMPVGLLAFVSLQMKTAAVGKGEFSAADENAKIKFSDVAGCEEAKTELCEIVDFLKNPSRFLQLGAQPPRGLLLLGPPGNGKTMLARAVAGEAKCAFIHASGSAFENVFVGTGARNIRALFKAARKKAPCILFIDEIDSIGSRRRSSGANWESQTINQLLCEMDGFERDDGVVVIAATNFADNLDAAMIRPGRFSRHIHIGQPPLGARREILKLATYKMPLDSSVNLDDYARLTAGCSGADVSHLANEAAIYAARSGRDCITDADFRTAFDRILLGSDQGIRLNQEERRLVAVHEAGHAMVSVLAGGGSSITKATILPRGQSLGSVVRMPDDERILRRKSSLKAELMVCMAGRAAEEVVFGEADVSTGVGGDLIAARSLARRMVYDWAMTDDVESENLSEEAQIKRAVNNLINEALENARDLIVKQRNVLDHLVQELLLNDTLDGSEVRSIVLQNHITTSTES